MRSLILAAGAGIAFSTALAILGPGNAQPAASLAGAELFPAIESVLKSPRCQNYHTATNFPRQGDDRHPHRQNVSRGPADHGAPGLPCSACHGESNNPASGVPGAPHWGVAPLAQQWETLSGGSLCRQVTDPRRNGNRDLAHLRAHMTEDELVQWGWHPGQDAHGRERTLPPVGQAEFHALVRAWIGAGAGCPS